MKPIEVGVSLLRPAAETAATDDRQFSGLDRLYGKVAAARIRCAHIAVVGIGGVGSWAVEALARTGVSTITLIDLDHIAQSNINRQAHAIVQTVGQAKVLAMKERIHSINPQCVVHCVEEFASPDNWPHILPLGVNGVIDACDQMHAKEAICTWALSCSTPLVTVGAAGGKRMAQLVEVADLMATTHDPLLAQLRLRLRKCAEAQGMAFAAKRSGILAVFSKESVQAAHESCELSGADGSLNCHGYGSVVSVTATFGLCAAGALMDSMAD